MLDTGWLLNKRVRVYDHDQRPMSIIGVVIASEMSVQGDPQGPIYLYDVRVSGHRVYSGLPASRLAEVAPDVQ